MKIKPAKITELIFFRKQQSHKSFSILHITGLQINLYLEQPMEIQLFATFFQRRKWHKKRLTF
jgi:hypothetical protein